MALARTSVPSSRVGAQPQPDNVPSGSILGELLLVNPMPERPRMAPGQVPAGRQKHEKPRLSEFQFGLLYFSTAKRRGYTAAAPKAETTDKVYFWNSPDNPNRRDPESCAVCIDDIKYRDSLVWLPCSHAFHVSCIRQWLLERTDECPLCKRSVLYGLGLNRFPNNKLEQRMANGPLFTPSSVNTRDMLFTYRTDTFDV